jgi:hypothetical protein
LDGIGCAVVGKLLGFQWISYASYNKGKYYISQVVHTALRSLPNVEWLYLADISLSDKIWEEIKPDVENINVRLIDHHETSKNAETYKDRVKVDLDLEISAAKIFYNLFKDEYPELIPYKDFIEAVSAYDTWHFELSPIAKDLQRCYDCVAFQDPKNKYVKFSDRLSKFTNYCLNDPVSNTRKPVWFASCLELYRSIAQPKLTFAMKNCVEVFKDTAIVNLVSDDNIPMFEISWYFEDRLPDIKNVIYVISQKSGDAVISIRTRYDDIDVSQIAEQFGGGGHQKAAAISDVPMMSKHEVITSIKKFFLESEHNPIKPE